MSPTSSSDNSNSVATPDPTSRSSSSLNFDVDRRPNGTRHTRSPRSNSKHHNRNVISRSLTTASRNSSSSQLSETCDLPDPHIFADRLTSEHRLTPSQSATVHQMVNVCSNLFKAQVYTVCFGFLQWGCNLDRGDLLLRMSDKADRLALSKVVRDMMEKNSELFVGVVDKVEKIMEERWQLNDSQKV